ncbi:hypothetical protein B9Z65_23 [Elsinoe australis]|uniref:Uncharacterized protein n=1 Tax=Elsinoe australis TaxID=40998 RepID=A0A2P7YWH3_9PEZI|nr:hypothetical protein B9Z65_23 [Elsinoe australis]
MLGIEKDGPSPKCYFTHVQLPRVIDDKQPPTKKKPFSCILQSAFNHTVDLLVFKEAVKTFTDRLHATCGQERYARIHLKLKDVIESDFFNEYIKTGDIALLSEGKAGVDNIYSLHDGILRLDLDKPTYERAGLAGKPLPSPGRKHNKSRYVVELNLRLPSMVRGRPLFNRMVYAFTNALTETHTWLFFDLRNPGLNLEPRIVPSVPSETIQANEASQNGSKEQDSGATKSTTQPENSSTNETQPKTPPLARHRPLILPLSPEVTHLDNFKTPVFPSALDESDSIEATELLEWLSLAMMNSPRLRSGDKCDSTLSRYGVPDLVSRLGSSNGGDRQAESEDVRMDEADIGSAKVTDTAGDVKVQDLARIRYHGFITAKVASKMLITAIRAAAKEGTWAALRVQSLGGASCMVLINDGKAMVWEYS